MKKNKMIKQFQKIREKDVRILPLKLQFRDVDGQIIYVTVDDAGTFYWNCWECLTDVIEELTDGYAAVFSKKKCEIGDYDIYVLATDVHGVFINIYQLTGLAIMADGGEIVITPGGCKNGNIGK